MNAYIRTESGALIPADIRPDGTADIGNACTHCGGSTAFPFGRFVNRIPSSWRGDTGPEVIGYLCADCQAIECDRCGHRTIEYGAAPDGSGFWCDDCRDCAECGDTGAVPAANPEEEQDDGYAPRPERRDSVADVLARYGYRISDNGRAVRK